MYELFDVVCNQVRNYWTGQNYNTVLAMMRSKKDSFNEYMEHVCVQIPEDVFDIGLGLCIAGLGTVDISFSGASYEKIGNILNTEEPNDGGLHLDLQNVNRLFYTDNYSVENRMNLIKDKIEKYVYDNKKLFIFIVV